MEGIEKKKEKRYSNDAVIDMLIATYPGAITVEDGLVNFDDTCDNFTEIIMEKFEPGRQKYYFAREFEGYNDCKRYVRNELQRLLERCQEFVDEHPDKFDD